MDKLEKLVSLCKGDIGGVKAKARHQARSSALYAAIIAREYPRLVEHAEPDVAMRDAIGKAESVVKVWEEVVSGK